MENQKTVNWDAIERFNSLATLAQSDVSANKAAGQQKAESQKSLSDIVLKVLANGTLKDTAHVRKSFKKDAPFFSLRMILSRCQAVLNYLNAQENKTFSYTLGKGDKAVTYTVTMTELKEVWKTDDALSFNVSSAFNYVKSLTSAEIELSDEDKAIALYLEASGLNEKDFAEMIKHNDNLRSDAIAQGLTLLGEQNREALENDVRFKEDEIVRMFHDLPEAKQADILAKLQPQVVTTTRKTA